MRKPVKIEVYTDGSARNNGQENSVGGWAYVVVRNGDVIHNSCGYVIEATNQQMELEAAIQACNYLKDTYCGNPFDEYKIYSDSAYLVNCVNNKWYHNWLGNDWVNSKGEPVANKGYWERLLEFFDDYQFSFYKVKGHSDNQFNNMADRMATGASDLGRLSNGI